MPPQPNLLQQGGWILAVDNICRSRYVMFGYGILAAAAITLGLTLSACAPVTGGEAGAHRKTQTDYQKAIQRNGRPPVGGARAND